MDVVNKTGTQSFQVHQLSAIGEQWEISSLQAVDTTVFPSQGLMSGQALSCFFLLKVGTTKESIFVSYAQELI